MKRNWKQVIYPNRYYTVYLVVCERYKHIYIGITTSTWDRHLQYLGGRGAHFVRRHGFKKFIEVYKNVLGTTEALRLENELTNRLSKMPEFCVSGGDIARAGLVF